MKRGRIKAFATVTAAAVGLTGLTGLAVLATGNPVRSVPLNDAGVWVTNDDAGVLGRQDTIARALDAVLTPADSGKGPYRLDVLQDGGTVVGYDRRRAQLLVVDPVLLTQNTSPVQPGSQIAMAGGTLAVYSPASGKIWATRYTPGAPPDDLTSVGPQAEPVAALTPSTADDAGAMTVTAAGSVVAVDVTGRRVRVDPGDDGFGKPQIGPVGRRAAVAISAVGDHIVVVDPHAGSVQVDDGARTDVGATDVSVQQPGPDRPTVLLASSRALISVPITGGGPSVLYSAANGRPARPLVYGDCAYAAWAGPVSKVTQACGDEAPAERRVPRDVAAQSRPIFRANQGQVVLNDQASGQVYDPEIQNTIDNWRAAIPAATVSTHQNDPTQTKTAKIEAVPYSTAARTGRTNVVHPVDSAHDTSGAILTIADLKNVRPSGAQVSLLGDGQSVTVAFPKNARSVTFTAIVSNGIKTAPVPVTVTAVRGATNTQPQPPVKPLRNVTVAAGGRIVIPLTTGWRDQESDPITVQNPSAKQGSVALTPDGTSLVYAAPANASGTDTIRYTITDGRGGDVPSTVPVTIATTGDGDPVSPTTEPDVVRAVVGGTAVVYPTANDLPGADPGDTEAAMTLLDVTARQKDAASLDVATDDATGRVTIASTAKTPASYLLDYTATFGTSKASQGEIRVDFVKATSDVPVTGPDTAVVHGPAPVLVDVLANDTDPQGRVLTVQSAEAHSPLQVAVVGGRWLRIASTAVVDPKTHKSPTSASVGYTVTADGTTTATGTVDVSLLPALTRDLPVATADSALVRTGDSVQVPVLANDSTPGGASLSLAPTVEGAPAPGRLPVTDVADPKNTDVGTAYASGTGIRYFAPRGVKTARTVVIPYVAMTPTGDSVGSTLTVTIMPLPTDKNPDLEPSPADIEARAASGETITIPLPPGGHDPDGDSTVVAGLGSAPRLGRILGFSPTSLTYQAYPVGDTGTDTFRYVVSDPFGKTGTATIRVAVTPPQPPQVVVPVPDQITAAPGARVTINPLENDLIGRGDSVGIRLLTKTAGATLPSGAAGAKGPVTATAPRKGAAPAVIGYAVDGLAGPSAPGTITVRSQPGYQNPPVVYDVVAPPTDKDVTTVDVLARAYDPDGDSTKLAVAVDDPAVTVSGGKLRLPVKNTPQAIGFTVTDESGAAAAAVVYVPAAGSGGPFVPIGKVIAIETNGTAHVRLADYVVSPTGKQIRLDSAKGAAIATPANGLTVRKSSAEAIDLAAAKNYNGPAALVVAVVEAGATSPTTLSIPVQVGPERAILRSCPADPVTVSALGDPVQLDITRLCHVWIPAGQDPTTIRYAATWQGSAPAGVHVGNGHLITVAADDTARSDETGRLQISVDGSSTGGATMSVAVQSVAPLVVTPVTRDHVKAGDSVTVDLSTSVTSPLKTPHIEVRQAGSVPASVGSGSAQGAVLQVTPSATAKDRITIPVEVTDDAAAPHRWVATTVTLVVFGVPDKPTGVAPGVAAVNATVSLDWTPGSANGAPVDYFEVASSDGLTQKCAAAPCTITGLPVGKTVKFHVHAHNEAGFSDWSDWSPEVTVDVKPDPVTQFTATPTGTDRQITLTWVAATSTGSPVDGYHLSGPVSADLAVVTSTTVTVPDDGTPYPFTLVAHNKAGDSVAATTTGYAYGPPTPPASVTVSAGADPQIADVSWPAGDPHDAGDLTYTLTDQNGTVLASDQGLLSQAVPVTYGQTYTFSVTVTNDHGLSAGPVTSASYSPVGDPGEWSAAPVITDEGDGTLSFSATVPPTNGGVGTLKATARGRDTGDHTRDLPAVGAAGGPITDEITGLNNGEPYILTLTVCNDARKCTTSPPSSQETPFGIPKISSFTASVVDGHIEYDVAVNANGRWASITVTSDNGAALLSKSCFDSCDWGAFPWAPGPGTYALTAKITRNFDGESDSSMVSDLIIDAPPPPESVTVSLGSDTGGTECGGNLPCLPVYLTASNYPPATACSPSADGTTYPGLAGMSAPASDAVVAYWFPGSSFTVTCDQASDTATYP